MVKPEARLVASENLIHRWNSRMGQPSVNMVDANCLNRIPSAFFRWPGYRCVNKCCSALVERSQVVSAQCPHMSRSIISLSTFLSRLMSS